MPAADLAPHAECWYIPTTNFNGGDYSMAERDDSPTDTSQELEAQLLTDVEKWWEFLDPNTYEVRRDLPTHGDAKHSELLDWTKTHKTDRMVARGLDFHGRCADCSRPMPAEMTFCVHCGGEPRRKSVRWYTLSVHECRNETSLEAAVDIIHGAAPHLEREDLRNVLLEPPAVFNIWGDSSQLAAVCTRLAQQGIYGRAFKSDDPSLPWLRETFESIVRHNPSLALFIGIIAFTLLGGYFWSIWAVFLGPVLFAFFFHRQLRWYREHYVLDAVRLQNRMSEFPDELASEASRLLRALQDEKIRGHFTFCLMEYYAVMKLLRDEDTVFSDALAPMRQGMLSLLRQVIDVVARYQKAEGFAISQSPARLRQEIDALMSRMPADATARKYVEEEIKHRKEMIEMVETMDARRPLYEERIAAMAQSMEVMRARLMSLRARQTAMDETSMEVIFAELDAELQVFEETFVTMEA